MTYTIDRSVVEDGTSVPLTSLYGGVEEDGDMVEELRLRRSQQCGSSLCPHARTEAKFLTNQCLDL